MKKPTQKEINEIKTNPPDLLPIYEKLVAHNIERNNTYGRNKGDGAFTIIGDKCEMTSKNVKTLLSKGVKKWKDRHYLVVAYALQYVKKC
jgi:hypothetical protein